MDKQEKVSAKHEGIVSIEINTWLKETWLEITKDGVTLEAHYVAPSDQTLVSYGQYVYEGDDLLARYN